MLLLVTAQTLPRAWHAAWLCRVLVLPPGISRARGGSPGAVGAMLAVCGGCVTLLVPET